jgi:hypothetical protein
MLIFFKSRPGRDFFVCRVLYIIIFHATHVITCVVLDLIILYRIIEYHFNRLNVVKRYRFSRPQPGCRYNQTLPGRESLNYSRPGRTWLVTSRLKTGKTITFFTVQLWMTESICRERNGVHGRAETGSRPFLGYRSAAERPARRWRPLPATRGRIQGEHPLKRRTLSGYGGSANVTIVDSSAGHKFVTRYQLL